MEATQHFKHSSVNEDYRVVLIPKDMVDFIKEKLGKDVLWVYDEESKELTLIKRPDSYTEALSGLGEEMWKEVGGTEYIRRDREQWDD
ncbi:hypothetical protein [Desulfosporosinus hippei]|uniref:SpoVT-AbrB domain-containing protein n=1 Tax=Desulfosporosinus hippei DSM 8344 TaxID=1121419 RepID=A0A1G8H3R4_9FIRM|nr:hypothetical protein [Desulfosporosinus hippei]SDI01284.1 hypothetical protein SAMN05443529_12442 [Desulfosporosinus hippei DSM 8344]